MRRGEVPFVAVRIGRSNDPREVLGLSRELRIPSPHALGLVTLWEEMILEVGDAMTGRLHGYTAEHIAAKLAWEGPPRKLLAALAGAGVIRQQRATFLHPYWPQSITGQYARDRAELRERWREKKRRQRAGDVPGDISGTEGDVPPLSPEKTHIDRSIYGTGGEAPGSPPHPPPQAGGSLGASRWDWIAKNHPRPSNSRACTRLLAELGEELWALVQWSVGLIRNPGPKISLSKKRALKADAHRFLSSELYLQFLPEWREKLERDKAPPAPRPKRPSKQQTVAIESPADVARRLAELKALRETNGRITRTPVALAAMERRT